MMENPAKKSIKPKSILKKIKKTNNVSFLERITTIHGTNYFSLKKGKSLMLWYILMMTNIIATVVFILAIKDRYNSDDIITKIYSDCHVNQVPFPAVSICNYNMVSFRESRNIADILNKNNIPQSEITAFFQALPNLVRFSDRSRNVGNFSAIMDILKKHYFTVESIMKEVHQKCENLLLYCEFNKVEKTCKDIFVMIQTYLGHCCAFNYAAISDASEDSLPSHDLDFEYYYDQSSFEKTHMITTLQSGKSSGLRVVLNVEPEDYPTWSFTYAYGAKVLLNDPNDFPETTVLYKYLSLGETLDMKVSPMIFQAEENLRSVSVEARGCLFNDEVLLQHTDRYSFETCQTECKMQTYLKICGCIPYKYPREKFAPTCELKDLRCLHNITIYWTKEMPCKQKCFIECRDKGYSVTADTLPILSEHYPDYVTKGRNVSDLSALQVYFQSSTCNCYKLSLLIDFNVFIATYGGVFSLSFGVSIITVFEIAYLMLALFGKIVWRKVFGGFYITNYID